MTSEAQLARAGSTPEKVSPSCGASSRITLTAPVSQPRHLRNRGAAYAASLYFSHAGIQSSSAHRRTAAGGQR
jgi:hypothetical protein